MDSGVDATSVPRPDRADASSLFVHPIQALSDQAFHLANTSGLNNFQGRGGLSLISWQLRRHSSSEYGSPPGPIGGGSRRFTIRLEFSRGVSFRGLLTFSSSLDSGVHSNGPHLISVIPGLADGGGGRSPTVGNGVGAASPTLAMPRTPTRDRRRFLGPIMVQITL